MFSWCVCSKPCRPSSWPRASASRATAWWRISCSPTTKNVARTPAASSASSTKGVPSGSGPSSKVRQAPRDTCSRPGMYRHRSAVSSISPYDGMGDSALGALLARAEQALAQLRLLLRRGVEGRELGQIVEPGEAEQLLEERRRPVEHRAELRA